MLINLVFLFLNIFFSSSLINFEIKNSIHNYIFFPIFYALLTYLLNKFIKNFSKYLIICNILISVIIVSLLANQLNQIARVFSFILGQFIGLIIAYSWQFHKIWSKQIQRALTFIFPFALPYLGATILENWMNINFWIWLAYVAIIICFFPRLICYLWGCRKIEAPECVRSILVKTKLKHIQILNWPIFNQSTTAAIVGFIPYFRSILITDRLRSCLSNEELAAVVAHEIGHQKYKHLLFYPLIFIPLNIVLDHLGTLLSSWILYVVIILVFICYFRIVFGFFSRLFERQADLYPLTIGVSVNHLQNALKKVAITSSTPLNKPNWHHYSFEKRIEIIEKACCEKNFIKKHNRLSLISRLFFFIGTVIYILYLLKERS